MATASEICDVIAMYTKIPVGDVARFARALITSGDLPKAVGRSVPELDMLDRAKLLLAIAACDRPAGCPKAMRDRFEAQRLFSKKAITAGEFLAEQLTELRGGNEEYLRRWTYSRILVSRGHQPSVEFEINKILAGHEGYEPDSLKFVGGAWLANTLGSIEKLHRDEVSCSGFRVYASIPGEVLMAVAAGSVNDWMKVAVERALPLDPPPRAEGK